MTAREKIEELYTLYEDGSLKQPVSSYFYNGTTDVEIDGTVDTDTPGTYMVRYTYPDTAGYGVAILTVVVE